MELSCCSRRTNTSDGCSPLLALKQLKSGSDSLYNQGFPCWGEGSCSLLSNKQKNNNNIQTQVSLNNNCFPGVGKCRHISSTQKLGAATTRSHLHHYQTTEALLSLNIFFSLFTTSLSNGQRRKVRTASMRTTMCNGTYVVSYSCGHVVHTPNVCLQDIASHYRCEPKGMKITQPRGRCVECYARELEPKEDLPTTARFAPDPTALANLDSQHVTPRSSADSEQHAAVARW